MLLKKAYHPNANTYLHQNQGMTAFSSLSWLYSHNPHSYIRETDICLFKISWWNRHPWCAYSTFSDFFWLFLTFYCLFTSLFPAYSNLLNLFAVFEHFSFHSLSQSIWRLFLKLKSGKSLLSKVRSYSPDCLHPSTTIRIPSNVISGPFWPA